MQSATLAKFVKEHEHDHAVFWPGGVSAVVTRCRERTRVELKMTGPLGELWQQLIDQESKAASISGP